MEKVEEGDRARGGNLGDVALYLRLGVAVYGIDLSRKFDVVATAHVFTMEIRHVPDMAKSIRFFEQALILDPDNVDILRSMGAIFEEMERLDEAEACYDRLAELEPGGIEAWVRGARQRLALGLHEEAASMASRAIEIDALDRASWYTLGLALHGIGHHAEAVDCFDKAIHIDPRYAQAWLAKARSQEAMGLIEEARTNIKMAQELGLEE